LRLNQGFDQILTALAALRRHPAFPAGELERFAALSKETRAATNSFLTSVMEAAETAEAGRCYQKLERFAALSKEARAATNSCLTSVMEAAETAEAGRRYHKRRRQERKEDAPT